MSRYRFVLYVAHVLLNIVNKTRSRRLISVSRYTWTESAFVSLGVLDIPEINEQLVCIEYCLKPRWKCNENVRNDLRTAFGTESFNDFQKKFLINNKIIFDVKKYDQHWRLSSLVVLFLAVGKILYFIETVSVNPCLVPCDNGFIF